MASIVPVEDTTTFGLPGQWSAAENPAVLFPHGRFQGEIEDLVVYGEIPREIDGTFYRMMVDPFYPLDPKNAVPIEGDGNVCAFRFHKGHVDMKIKYVQTERLRLERKARRRLFGLYRNPFSHHPCVRAAVDSTANTNIIRWAGQLLALKEVALPYAIDPHTLDTLSYDPFGPQIQAKTFSAHPKVDPFTNELVVFGYEAKGLATLDIVIYSLDASGKAKDEQWIKSPWPAFIHDCAITENFIVLMLWPFEADLQRMASGGHHWEFNAERPTTFIVVPRKRHGSLPDSWRQGEHRVYHWENCTTLHSAGAWEDGQTIYLESSRISYNPLPCFEPGQWIPPAEAKADFVRWAIDLSRPDGSKIPAPTTILDLPSEMPRIDERLLTRNYAHIFLPVILPHRSSAMRRFAPAHLNALAKVDKRTGVTEYFDPGSECQVQEPIFIPRSEQAPEGDGWVMAMVERLADQRSDLVVLDTNNFAKPVAIVQLPFRVQGQIHGNWVEQSKDEGYVSLVEQASKIATLTNRGALEPEGGVFAKTG